MKRGWDKGYRAGFIFIEIILVLAVILFIIHRVLKVYFKGPSLNGETGKALSGYGIDTTNYKTAVDSVRGKIKDIQKQRADKLTDTK